MITPRPEVKLLGSLITQSQESRDHFFQERISKIQNTLPLLKELSHQAHILLLRQCLLAKPAYLLSTMLISPQTLEEADTIINTHLASTFGTPEQHQFLFNAPLKEGGFGIPSFKQTAKPALIHAITQLHPELWDSNPLITFGTDEERDKMQVQTARFSPTEWVQSQTLQFTEEETTAGKKGQSDLRSILSRRSMSDAITNLSKRNQDKYVVLSTATVQNGRQASLPTELALNNALLQPPLSWNAVFHKHRQLSLQTNTIICPLCKETMREEHAQCCARTSAIRTKRHNAIKLLLERACREVPGIQVEENNHRFISKTTEKTNGGTGVISFSLDLVIVQDFSSRTQTEIINPQKRESTIIGIGFSDNGHIGPNASSFLDFLKELARAAHVTNPVPSFLASTSAMLEHTRAFAEEAYLDLLQRLEEAENDRTEKTMVRDISEETHEMLAQLSPDSIPTSSIFITTSRLRPPTPNRDHSQPLFDNPPRQPTTANPNSLPSQAPSAQSSSQHPTHSPSNPHTNWKPDQEHVLDKTNKQPPRRTPTRPRARPGQNKQTTSSTHSQSFLPMSYPLQPLHLNTQLIHQLIHHPIHTQTGSQTKSTSWTKQTNNLLDALPVFPPNELPSPTPSSQHPTHSPTHSPSNPHTNWKPDQEHVLDKTKQTTSSTHSQSFLPMSYPLQPLHLNTQLIHQLIHHPDYTQTGSQTKSTSWTKQTNNLLDALPVFPPNELPSPTPSSQHPTHSPTHSPSNSHTNWKPDQEHVLDKTKQTTSSTHSQSFLPMSYPLQPLHLNPQLIHHLIHTQTGTSIPSSTRRQEINRTSDMSHGKGPMIKVKC
ncbi:hypothetical protein BLNAU_22782 [Blattamonas nauphoetae]|uniref:Uncharacterized protein n=1 Tax=Blattamonas nauphoetae TaxID=2049346 RepID=A0ABQ9WS15_9EUKA|nr:hypothetical protein BLNAU_22782 [Blattamonas nauphoetae]